MEYIERKLVLPDGSQYYGYGFGSPKEGICELVFNTSMVGYQEIVSDPSYTNQFVVMAYPLIGNYGINFDDFETKNPSIGGLVVRDYNDEPSNFRSKETLSDLLAEYDIPGISGIDTRLLVRRLRNEGLMNALITGADTPSERAMDLLKGFTAPHDAVMKVSRQSVERYIPEGAKYHIVAVDFGMKQNIINELIRRKCEVTVVPWNISADEVRRMRPDALFLSNGPGDPADVREAAELVKELKGSLPIFGICLGHQIISLAYGAKTYKLKFGHRGGNHPVKDMRTGRIEMTSQNHSYAVDAGSIRGTGLEVTHINLLDGTVEGVMCPADKTFSVQYHPESSPGPEEAAHLFDEFIEMI